MSPEELDKLGKTYREEWYKSKGYPMDLSWGSLPPEDKQRWVSEAIAFDNDPTQQEEIA